MKLPRVKTNIQIRFTDLDQLGHVSNSMYAQYLDLGRIDLFLAIEEQLATLNVEEPQPLEVVASMKIDYLREIQISDTVHLETWCEKIGNKSMQLSQHVYANNECAAKATVIVVAIDPETKRTIQYPRDWQPTE